MGEVNNLILVGDFAARVMEGLEIGAEKGPGFDVLGIQMNVTIRRHDDGSVVVIALAEEHRDG